MARLINTLPLPVPFCASAVLLGHAVLVRCSTAGSALQTLCKLLLQCSICNVSKNHAHEFKQREGV